MIVASNWLCSRSLRWSLSHGFIISFISSTYCWRLALNFRPRSTTRVSAGTLSLTSFASWLGVNAPRICFLAPDIAPSATAPASSAWLDTSMPLAIAWSSSDTDGPWLRGVLITSLAYLTCTSAAVCTSFFWESISILACASATEGSSDKSVSVTSIRLASADSSFLLSPSSCLIVATKVLITLCVLPNCTVLKNCWKSPSVIP